MIRPTKQRQLWRFPVILGKLCSNRLFPKKNWYFLLKKYLKKRSIFSPVKYKTIDWYWRLVNPKLEKKITPSETRQKLKRDVFSLRGQKWILYSFEQSKLTPSFWIRLIRKNFARKFYFPKIRPTITTNGSYDVFQFFFGTLCSTRLFPKKKLKFFVEKTIEKTQHFLRL